MKILITERQCNLIVEQWWDDPNRPELKKYAPTEWEKMERRKIDQMFNSFDPHTWIQMAAIGAAFIPIVGPVISLGIELFDANLYYKEGKKLEGDIAVAFSIIPLVGKLPFVKKLSTSAWKSLSEKVIIDGGENLTKVETEVIKDILANKKVIENEISLMKASINNYKQGYLKNYGRQSYDELMKKFLKGDLTADQFKVRLEQGARFKLTKGVNSATTRFGIKYTKEEFDDITITVAEISRGVKPNGFAPQNTELLGVVGVKTPKFDAIRILGYDSKWVDDMARKWNWNQKTINSWKNTGGMAVGGEPNIYINLNNVDVTNYPQLRDLVFHEIGHIKDPAMIKSSKLAKTYNSEGFPKDEKYYFHQFEITANASSMYNAITDISNKWLRSGLTKEEVIKQLKILRNGLTTGNVGKSLSNFIDPTGRGLYANDLQTFYANRHKFPKEYNKTIGRLVQHIDEIISDFSK